MAWKVEFDPAAVKQLAKLDKPVQRRIIAFLESRAAANPREHGAGMTGPLTGYWKYRIGDYRAVADLQDGRLVILVVVVGHRREVYR